MSRRYWRRRIRPLAGHWRGEDIGPVLTGETEEDERIVRPGTAAYRRLAETASGDLKLYAFAERGQALRVSPPWLAMLMQAGWLAPGGALWLWQAEASNWVDLLRPVLFAVGLLFLAYAGQTAALRGLRDARMAVRHRSWDRLLSSPGDRRAHADRRESRAIHAKMARFCARMELQAWLPTGLSALLALSLTAGAAGTVAPLLAAAVFAVAAAICDGLGMAHGLRMHERAEAALRRTGSLKYAPWSIGYGQLSERLQEARNFLADRIRRLHRQSAFDDFARSIDLAGLTLTPLAAYAATSANASPVAALFALALGKAAISGARAALRLRRVKPPLARQTSTGAAAEPSPFVSLEARAVGHAHGTGAPLFQPVSFWLRPGEVLALTGPSGIGKSTLMRLLMGLEQPRAGHLLLNGTPLDGTHAKAWRASAACVMQDERDEPGTISAVIGAGLADMSSNAIEAATQVACVHEEISALPMGYLTLMIEGAMPRALSARIAIARCFAARPRILFLDETLSCLDTDTAARILANARAQDVAVVIVSHRPDVLALADHTVALGAPVGVKVE
ncbi:ATP-binding cassette domain-containing protein [Rhizobium sp. ARZ01]|uniref:ATP-binding cassette domain-containing protein n=1 Tax=Rhizobium sp. ARZ01 TaxID=2769313 RepID=UPI00177B8B8F|nr:ATP-binding cassette domain-containing protein [Rhizobium sp. ARZ01]MBD9375559.1 ATP-binding cassette domain-containing protein [Rhizobium sp. ARZ01]